MCLCTEYSVFSFVIYFFRSLNISEYTACPKSRFAGILITLPANTTLLSAKPPEERESGDLQNGRAVIYRTGER